MSRQTELDALAERVATIEAENEMLRRQAGWYYRKWHTAEARAKQLEVQSRRDPRTGRFIKVQPEPTLKHGGEQ